MVVASALCKTTDFNTDIKTISNDLLMIYRVRNLIVHNAVMIEPTMNLYARKTYAMARYITTYIMDRYVDGEKLEDILVGIVVKAQMRVHRTINDI